MERIITSGNAKYFEELPLKKRKELVFSKRLCFNCLNYGHSSGKCRTKLECATCKGKHHTLLHSDKAESSKPTESKDASATTLCARKGNSVYFPIVAVKGTSQRQDVEDLGCIGSMQ